MMKSVNYPLNLLLISLSGVYVGHRITEDIFISGREIGQPIFWMSVSLSIIFFILLLIDRKIFIEWLKFGIPILAISVFIIIVTPGSCSNLLCFERGEVSFFIAMAFLVINFIFIRRRYYRYKTIPSRSN